MRDEKKPRSKAERHKAPTPPRVKHFRASVIGKFMTEPEPNSAERRLAATCCSGDLITRSPDHLITRSSAPAGPHYLASVIGGLAPENEVATAGPRVPRREDRAVTPNRIDFVPAGAHFPTSVIGGVR